LVWDGKNAMKKRGVSLIEVSIAAALLLYSIYAFLIIYSTTVRYEVHSQNRVLAAALGSNLLEEAEAHRYGLPAPTDWGLSEKGLVGEWSEVTIPVVVSRRPVAAKFHIQRSLKNGSFIGMAASSGAPAPSWDVYSAVISWSEGSIPKDTNGPFGQAYFGSDNMHLVVQVPMWY
jgi:hypothetical protein